MEKKKRRGGDRRRTGCSTCKARHVRCDEQLPKCSTCQRLGLNCERPPLKLTAWSPTKTTSRSKARSKDQSAVKQRTESLPLTPDALNKQVNQASHRSATRTSSRTTRLPISSLVEPSPDDDVVLDEQTSTLLTAYRDGPGPWMDLFDHANTYQMEIIRRALQSKVLLRSLCAFAARTLSFKGEGSSYWDRIAATLYVEAIQLLIDALIGQAEHEDALAACILLNSYEVVGPGGLDHERHYRGAADIIKHYNIGPRSTGVNRASFWIFVRHDIWIALTEERPMKIAASTWQIVQPEKDASEDIQANWLMWLVARTIDLMYGEAGDDIVAVQHQVDQWIDSRDAIFKGISVRCTNGSERIYFAIPSTSAAMVYYELLLFMLKKLRSRNVRESKDCSELSSAEKILQVSESDLIPGARCYTVVALYYVGKYISSVPIQNRIRRQFEATEYDLGYLTQPFRSKLEKHWQRLSQAS